MPIYEFYCMDCNTLFNFFSRSINTKKVPTCPKCGKVKLSRQMSAFAITGRATESGDMDDLPIDESRMEKAMTMLAAEADKIDENDPKQAANLMRRLTDMTGLELGSGMQEALSRLESGEDPDAIEAEMGHLLESEEPFAVGDKKGGKAGQRRKAPLKDETLYDL
ncbi:MAG: FmdB family zinc ribbon protein [Pseudomonadota bacterium]